MGYESPYQPPRKQTNPLVWVFVALAAVCCLCIFGVVGMGWTTFNQVGKMIPCTMTLTAAQKAMDLYVAEKGAYPAADKWQTELSPYYEEARAELSKEFDDAPGPMKDWGATADITAPLTCDAGPPETFILFNSKLSGVKEKDVKDRSTTVVLFESDVKKMNGNQVYKERPITESPKMFGEHRGFFTTTADGDMGSTAEGSRRTKITIDPTDKGSKGSKGAGDKE